MIESLTPRRAAGQEIDGPWSADSELKAAPPGPRQVEEAGLHWVGGALVHQCSAQRIRHPAPLAELLASNHYILRYVACECHALRPRTKVRFEKAQEHQERMSQHSSFHHRSTCCRVAKQNPVSASPCESQNMGYHTACRPERNRPPMISSHPRPVPCQWFSKLATVSLSNIHRDLSA